MNVKEIMTEERITVNLDESIQCAAAKMKDQDVGCVVAMADGKAAGMLTDRDIVLRAVSEDCSPAGTAVRDVLSPELVTCSPGDSVEHAAELMIDNTVRRLLVVNEQDEPVGVVSLGDLAAHIEDNTLAGKVLESICCAP